MNESLRALESWARANVQDFIQGLLEQEVNEFIGRLKSERHVGPGRRIYRNGHGKIRNFGMMGGTIQVQRPRVRNAEERFESRIIPWCSSVLKEKNPSPIRARRIEGSGHHGISGA